MSSWFCPHQESGGRGMGVRSTSVPPPLFLNLGTGLGHLNFEPQSGEGSGVQTPRFLGLQSSKGSGGQWAWRRNKQVPGGPHPNPRGQREAGVLGPNLPKKTGVMAEDGPHPWGGVGPMPLCHLSEGPGGQGHSAFAPYYIRSDIHRALDTHFTDQLEDPPWSETCPQSCGPSTLCTE